MGRGRAVLSVQAKKKKEEEDRWRLVGNASHQELKTSKVKIGFWVANMQVKHLKENKDT